MSDGLSELEQKFFETGELPPEIVQNEAAGDAEVPDSTPAIPEASEAAPEHATGQQTPDVANAALDTLRRSLQEERQLRNQLEQKFQEVLKQASQPQEMPLPDANEDPLGHTVAQVQRLAEQLKGLDSRMSETSAQQQQLTQLQNFVSHVHQQRDVFMKDHPDYMDAYKHMRGIRMQDYRDLGVPEENIPHMMLQEEMNAANAAIQNGRNPAELIYNFAKRYGYKGQSQPTKQNVPAEDKIEQLKKGMVAAKTVQKAAGSDVVNVDSLREMGDEDVLKVVADEDAWQRVVGGRAGGKSIF